MQLSLKRKAKRATRKWFAWYPVTTIDKRVVWLETVKRRVVWHNFSKIVTIERIKS